MSNTHFITKKRSFQHLTPYQRGKIQALIEQKIPKTQIAKQVGIARSTLYAELKRGTVQQMRSNLTTYSKYFAQTGQLVYEKNRKACRKPYKLAKVSDYVQYLEKAIQKEKLSPDAICGRAKREGNFPAIICTKTVYNYIDLGLIKVKNIDLTLKLRRNTHKHHCRKNRRILGMSIEQRPESVKNRQEFGHWEIDTVVGKREAGEVLLTLDERMTRKRHIIKITGKNKQSVGKALRTLQNSYGEMFQQVFKTVTSDNGSEFSGLTEALTGVDVYFAHPYSSGERGTNEKQNSIVRRFIPKSKDMGKVSDYIVQKAEDFINDLPRKMFDYRTPRELFDEQIALLSQAV